MRKLLRSLPGLLLLTTLWGCGPSSAENPAPPSPPGGDQVKLTVFAAASLKGPLDTIIASYADAAPNVAITVNYGGSGALQTQIEQGAPADIFISAGARQMDALESKGLLVSETRTDLLKNEIVLIIPKNAPVTAGSFNDVAADDVAGIALGEPGSVPAGQYAQETFTYLGIWDKVSAKATFGSDVRQVLSWVASGNADCGVVYKTDALSDESVRIVAEAPGGSHTPAVYPAAVIKAGANKDAAAAFIRYMQSGNGRNVFEKSGFSA